MYFLKSCITSNLKWPHFKWSVTAHGSGCHNGWLGSRPLCYSGCSSCSLRQGVSLVWNLEAGQSGFPVSPRDPVVSPSSALGLQVGATVPSSVLFCFNVASGNQTGFLCLQGRYLTDWLSPLTQLAFNRMYLLLDSFIHGDNVYWS